MSLKWPFGYTGKRETGPTNALPIDPDASGECRLSPSRRVSLATATRDYARAADAGTLERKAATDLAPWIAAMGPELWSWQRARLLTDQPPWRASPNVEEAHERARALERMERDIATWERALVVLDARIHRAQLYHRPVPAPLAVPPAVLALIEAKRKAALERTARSRARGEGGGSPPALRPDDDVPRPSFPSKPM